MTKQYTANHNGEQIIARMARNHSSNQIRMTIYLKRDACEAIAIQYSNHDTFELARDTLFKIFPNLRWSIMTTYDED